jgi:hypothetical protein
VVACLPTSSTPFCLPIIRAHARARAYVYHSFCFLLLFLLIQPIVLFAFLDKIAAAACHVTFFCSCLFFSYSTRVVEKKWSSRFLTFFFPFFFFVCCSGLFHGKTYLQKLTAWFVYFILFFFFFFFFCSFFSCLFFRGSDDDILLLL